MALVDCPCGRYKIDERDKICTYCGKLVASFAATRALSEDDLEDESVPRWGTARFSTRMNLILSLRGTDHRFIFDANEITELTIGRTDPDTGEKPALDLSEFGAVENGVSRRHASIIRKDSGSLQIVDKGSPNGTFLNGQRLVVNQPRILRDGDELRLGKMILVVRFEKG